MKITFTFLAMACAVFAVAQVNVGGTVNDKANEKTGEAIDAIWNAPGKLKKKSKDGTTASTDSVKTAPAATTQTASSSTAQSSTTQKTQTIPKAYQNYDFVPGSDLVFEDHFTEDMDGEFPAHWNLENGQGVINNVDGRHVLYLTDGNYARVSPNVKGNSYLSNAFSVEADIYPKEEDYGLRIFFYTDGQERMTVATNSGGLEAIFPNSNPELESVTLSSTYPSENSGENYYNRWHHIAISYKDQQLKIYIDQNRVLVVPNCHCKPTSVQFGGIASTNAPIKFTNIRIANGGNQNMLNKLMTDGKIISYGITFDVGKSDIKPESMGTLNELAKTLKENPTLKIEVGGHCDSDGDDASNLKLSQARADAVKAQLISMGVNATQLSAKGYGETKPVAPNTSFEGKAKNRRVEFVKQ